MTHQSALHGSLSYDAATARMSELRRQAEQQAVARLAMAGGPSRPVRPARRGGVSWPAGVVAALRESLAGRPTTGTSGTSGTTASIHDSSRPVCCA